MTHISLDLETLGVLPGSIILSIGAVVVDPITGETGEEFYVTIDRENSKVFGLTEDPETVDWWQDQRPEAWAAATADPITLTAALRGFATWFESVGGVELWGYGSNFDETLLAMAYRAASLPTPWSYKGVRCLRTLCALAGVDVPRDKGLHHNALDDARNQADALTVAYAYLGLGDDSAMVGFLADVRREIVRARYLFPGDRIMTLAMAEESGELVKAVLDEPASAVRKEAVQTAAMAARIVLDGDSSVTAWRDARGLDRIGAAA